MKTFLKRTLLLPIFILSCSHQINSDNSTWKSEHHPLEIQFSTPWELIASVSSEKKTVCGLIDKTDGKSVAIKISNDVSQELLSNADYYASTTEQMLAANVKNERVDEREVQFHGETYYRQIFIMHTDKWGVLQQHAYTRRDGEHCYSVQFSFPIQDHSPKDFVLPKSILDLDKNIRINNK